ncbi:hypothetical protein STRDD10_00919 [Streptococcus sp. DD10]|nr:hypothetical protein STRDD10_00919 [Streptococcus sp. DD10]
MRIGRKIQRKGAGLLTAYEIISVIFAFTIVVIEIIRLVIDMLRKK